MANVRAALAPEPLLAPVITAVLIASAVLFSVLVGIESFVYQLVRFDGGHVLASYESVLMPREKHPPLRGRPKTMDPESVCETAMRAYWQHDPADVSVNRICDLAGVSKPSLYREFGSEDGLKSAALDRYAEQVLTDLSAILEREEKMGDTLASLIDFATADPRMEKGCLFCKMRAGKHRLGPATRARVEAIEATAQDAYRAFLQAHRDSGAWTEELSVEAGAKYLGEQVTLAVTQRASGEDPACIRAMMTLALSVFSRP